MPTLDAERIGDTLWIAGNVDRSMEKDLRELLEKYQSEVSPDRQLVELSNVTYIASSSAKVLISHAQDVEAKGTRLKVRSSTPVVNALNLFGATSWLEIEACAKPNTKPPKEVRPLTTRIAVASQPTTKSTVSPQPSIHEAATSAVFSGQHQGIKAAMDTQYRVGETLVEIGADLNEAYGVLRELIVMSMYCFHLKAGDDLTGRVLSHIGGPWILIDTRGAKRMVNITQVTAIDVL